MQILNLVEQAKKTFKIQEHLSPYDIERLKMIMNAVDPTDLDLHHRMAVLPKDQGWHCEHIFLDDRFHLSLFMMPKGMTMPLHDHPNMQAFLKILCGTLVIRAYDWAKEYPFSGLARCSAFLAMDENDSLLHILPDQYNLHELYAVKDCAFLDLLSPPYNETEGRFCRYYRPDQTLILNDEIFTHLI